MKKVSYNPLWKTMIDKGIKNKTELIQLAGISSGTLAKMSKGQEVSLSVIVKLCDVLDCGIDSIIEIA